MMYRMLARLCAAGGGVEGALGPLATSLSLPPQEASATAPAMAAASSGRRTRERGLDEDAGDVEAADRFIIVVRGTLRLREPRSYPRDRGRQSPILSMLKRAGNKAAAGPPRPQAGPNSSV